MKIFELKNIIIFLEKNNSHFIFSYICGGALLFCRWETYWTFLDASYFSFISLSTIGFGDLVPGDKIYGRGSDFLEEVLELSFVFCSIYLMLGMALIAMCFSLMQVIHLFVCIKCIRQLYGRKYKSNDKTE